MYRMPGELSCVLAAQTSDCTSSHGASSQRFDGPTTNGRRDDSGAAQGCEREPMDGVTLVIIS